MVGKCARGLCKARVCCWNSSCHEGVISPEEGSSKLMVPNKYVSRNLCAFVFYSSKMERIRLHGVGKENKREIKANRAHKMLIAKGKLLLIFLLNAMKCFVTYLDVVAAIIFIFNGRSKQLFISLACSPGTFKSKQGEGFCSPCPPNSRTSSGAASICSCRTGYYRADNDSPESGCTSK